MFVRAKRQNSRTYYYLTRSVRKGHRVRQEVVAYLGPFLTPEAAWSVSGSGSRVRAPLRKLCRSPFNGQAPAPFRAGGQFRSM
jgi:hypothetical protein